MEPNTPLKWNWHHDLECEYLQAVRLGQINRLIINVCPRSMKSIITSVCFPDWIWIDEPWTSFLCGSYADTLATSLSVMRRNLIESDWYQAGYGDSFSLSPDVNTKTEFENDQTGKMKSSGIKGSVTGKGGDYIIIDDPHNPKGAESDDERESTIQNFDLAWSSRLNDKKTGRIIVIMQRLRENDLTGHLLEKNAGYVHVKIPSICEERTRIVFPITGRVVDREQGDLMHPERDGHPELAQAKKEMGPYGFSGQHQQDPVPRSGGIFKEDMFDFCPMPTEFDYSFVMADTAYKEKQENDFTVFTAYGVKNEELYVRDVWRKQIKADEVEVPAAAFIKRFSNWGFRGAYIEPKGHGVYLNQRLRKPPYGVMIPGDDQIEEFFSDRKHDKVMRANNAVPYLVNRRVHINELIAEKEELVKEALKFPKAAHDDFVDTLIDGIKFAFARSISLFDVL